MRWMPLSLAALAILAAGCGGGGHKSATTQSAVTTTKSTATATVSASGLTGLATTANCRQLADLSSTFSNALQGTDPKDVKKTAALLKQFADKTPAEIRPDFQTLAADYAKIADAVQGLDVKAGSTPDPKALAKLAKLSKEIDSAELAKAATNISTWAQKNCATK